MEYLGTESNVDLVMMGMECFNMRPEKPELDKVKEDSDKGYLSKDWWTLATMLIVGGVIVAFVTEWFLEWCK